MSTPSSFFSVHAQETNVNSYVNQIQALTLKDGTSAFPPKVISENPAYSFLYSPLLVYGSVILFFVVFLGAIGIQIFYRISNWKKTVTSLVVALVIATIPITVRTALQVTSLQTRASPDEVPKNIQINQSTARSFTLTWETTAEKTGAVRFGPAPLIEKNSRTVIADKARKTTKHTVVLTDLEPNTVYELEILSGGKWYNQNGQPLRFKLLNP